MIEIEPETRLFMASSQFAMEIRFESMIIAQSFEKLLLLLLLSRVKQPWRDADIV
jgi:hypothetical protein